MTGKTGIPKPIAGDERARAAHPKIGIRLNRTIARSVSDRLMTSAIGGLIA
jgi:hypothetical protein